jgi:hypothetical protein
VKSEPETRNPRAQTLNRKAESTISVSGMTRTPPGEFRSTSACVHACVRACVGSVMTLYMRYSMDPKAVGCVGCGMRVWRVWHVFYVHTHTHTHTHTHRCPTTKATCGQGLYRERSLGRAAPIHRWDQCVGSKASIATAPQRIVPPPLHPRKPRERHCGDNQSSYHQPWDFDDMCASGASLG